MLVSPAALHKRGMLGMNRRNLAYIARYNERRLYPLVDDKKLTKERAMAHGVATPTLRDVIHTQHGVRNLEERLDSRQQFTIKPSRGAGGKGILVVPSRDGDQFLKASGQSLSLTDLQRHCSNILAGLHSLAGAPDTAIIEDLIEADPYFEPLSVEGVPDIRVIIFRGIPVMAMLRLSTHASDGKANLHQGAIGVGLDLATGRCIHAVQHSSRVHSHPDTGFDLNQIAIPDWQHLLTLSARCHDLTGLGYLGADIVVDRHRGPLMLELNARPGLAIQIANGKGLLPRLNWVEKMEKVPEQAEARASMAMTAFGNA
ncbi:alpha-L-glutamate ligase-like protein [Halomonadaceae bacterium KBTZ08]